MSTPDTLPNAGARRWAEAPDVPVLHDGRWFTGAELEERSRVVAGRFAAAGLAPGDRLLLSGPTGIGFVTAHLAALRFGLVVVPVNPAYGAREVAHVVADCRPAAGVMASPEAAGWVRDAGGPRVVVTGLDVDLPDGPAPALDVAGADDLALIVYTSGTTGAPKGASLTHANLLAGARALTTAWHWTAQDRLVLALPLFHVHGLCVGLHGTLLSGGSAVLQPRFEASGVLDAVAAHAGSLFFGVPTMYARLAESPRLRELSALRLAVSGSAALSPALFDAVEKASGQRILERYGMSETLITVSNPYEGERKPGTVGLPLPGVDLRLDEDTDEILLRAPSVMRGYWQRPEATAESFSDGWFRTGDVGALDADGYVSIVGRRKELIISGGYNVYPREVEEVLRAHPGVRDAAVIGVPDATWGEAVTAFVEASGVAEAELLAHARAQLAPYKRPKTVVLVTALPRNALGKVVKAQLRAD
ncbi:class I adenylate-forming enzyme family protein [Spongisporangium articulatum]|uniref:Class I adenylate-forming enzyme family protein n=1 Tax=Spongisporangium articulatum TaxID=3362603 RepID=A0ABW8AGK3_9ACTN